MIMNGTNEIVQNEHEVLDMYMVGGTQYDLRAVFFCLKQDIKTLSISRVLCCQ